MFTSRKLKKNYIRNCVLFPSYFVPQTPNKINLLEGIPTVCLPINISSYNPSYLFIYRQCIVLKYTYSQGKHESAGTCARGLPENVGDASAGIGTIIPAFEGYLRSRVLILFRKFLRCTIPAFEVYLRSWVLTVFWEILSVANSTLINFKV